MIKNGIKEKKRRLEGGESKPTLYFKVTEMENINVYIYGGKSRNEATVSLVPGNEMPSINEVYMIDASADEGILVVAFPNKD